MSSKVTLWSVETGQRIERWSVDARGMVACGEYVTSPDELPGAIEPGAPVAEVTEPGAVFSGGYRVESAGSWHKAFGPDGEQIGKSQRSYEEAAALIPATHHVGGASVVPAEHSPGVPLETS